MIFDSSNLFSDAQAITATAASTNVIDLGPTNTPKHAANAITRDIGKGRPIDVRVQIVETFNNLTSLQLLMQGSVDEAFTSPIALSGTLVTLALSGLTQGEIVPITWVPRGTIYRYLRMNYIVTGTAPTAGKVTAGLVFANEERDV